MWYVFFMLNIVKDYRKISFFPGLALFFGLAGLMSGCAPASSAEPVPSTPVPATTRPTLPPPALVMVSPSATPTFAPTLTPTPAPTLTPTATPLARVGTPNAQTANRQVTVPILMYHYVEPLPPAADAIRQGLTVQPAAFAAQMAYLHANGYQTVSLYEVVDALAGHHTLPPKPVMLTFDDGYRPLMDFALPEMERYGFVGTVFVISEFMDREFAEYLTWEQARALHAAGWSVESHTKTHDRLEGRDFNFQLYQLLGSAQTIEANIGQRPRFLCYPAGRFDDLSVQVADQTGYWAAVTTRQGRTHTHANRFTLTRLRVDGNASLTDFANLVYLP